MNINFGAKFLNLVVVLFIAIMVLTLLGLPFLIDKYVELSGVRILNVILIKAILYITGIPFTILLMMVKVLCNNLLNKDPFCKNSIKALNIISICAFIDFFVYAISTIIILKNLFSLTIMVAAFMVGLTSLILSQLVKIAMEIKKENDLII